MNDLPAQDNASPDDSNSIGSVKNTQKPRNDSQIDHSFQAGADQPAQDQKSVPTIVPNSLPSGEGLRIPTHETQQSHEQVTSPEVVKPPEVLQTIAPEPSQQDASQQQASPHPQVEETETLNVVDARTGDEDLQSVDPNADSLTKRADKEEEEFIEEVEKHHVN
jgi:hypothetical protein